MSLKSAILMTTYNGEEFIREQIISIQNQVEKNWKLYIRDDGSTDNTLAIIKELASNDSRIKIVSNVSGNLGVKRGFMYLLHIVEAQYYFFCDQDDVWFPQKMSETLKKFNLHSKLSPILVHTNLTTVDKNLNVINENFHPTSSKIDNLNVMLASNSVTGCTMAINHALKEKVKNDSSESMIMHDWWLALCAETFGIVAYVPNPMIFYRQHEANQVGTDTTLKERFKKIYLYNNEIKKLNLSFKQANALLELHDFEMELFVKKMVNEYSNLLMKNRISRVLVLLRYCFKKRSFTGTLSLWYAVIVQPTVVD